MAENTPGKCNIMKKSKEKKTRKEKGWLEEEDTMKQNQKERILEVQKVENRDTKVIVSKGKKQLQVSGVFSEKAAKLMTEKCLLDLGRRRLSV